MAIKKLKVRGFEVARGWEDKMIRLPERSTENSAGYDFFAAADIYVYGDTPTLVPTGVKAYMKPGEFLLLANRSSGPLKKSFTVPWNWVRALPAQNRWEAWIS